MKTCCDSSLRLVYLGLRFCGMKDRKKWRLRRHSPNQSRNAGKLRKILILLVSPQASILSGRFRQDSRSQLGFVNTREIGGNLDAVKTPKETLLSSFVSSCGEGAAQAGLLFGTAGRS